MNKIFSKRNIRRIALVSILLLFLTLPWGYFTSEVRGSSNKVQSARSSNLSIQVAPERDNITIVGSDGWGTSGERTRAELVAFAPDGSIMYYNDTYDGYLDVDPVPNTSSTVFYVAHEKLPPRLCDGDRVCWHTIIEQANLSTGTTTRLYTQINPGRGSTRWHDVDYISGSNYVIADIYQDRVFILNVSTGTVTWSWSLQNAYNISTTGGKWPTDWSHLNDVEVLPPSAAPDAQFMLSVRNHDRVIFINALG